MMREEAVCYLLGLTSCTPRPVCRRRVLSISPGIQHLGGGAWELALWVPCLPGSSATASGRARQDHGQGEGLGLWARFVASREGLPCYHHHGIPLEA